MPMLHFARHPNVQRLKSDGDVEGLIEALGYQDDHNVRLDAASALGKIGDSRCVVPLIEALDDQPRIREVDAMALGEMGDQILIGPPWSNRQS